jgi:hypothetical protein
MSGNNGWTAEPYDPSDHPYRSQRDGFIEPSVNLVEKNGNFLLNVYNQRGTDSCVANAVAAAYRFLAKKLTADGVEGLVTEPSRLFIYYNARWLEDLDNPQNIDDEGSQNRNALKGASNLGVCDEYLWKWVQKKDANGKEINAVEDVNKKPTPKVYSEAAKSRVLEYCRLDPDHPDDIEKKMTDAEIKAVGVTTLFQLKQCLSEGYPVVFGFWYYWDEPPWDQSDTTWFLPPLPSQYVHKGPPKKWDAKKKEWVSYGGHTVLCVGYDEAQKRVLCQNSWGTDPSGSKDGLFWMDYSWITDWEATDDFWMIRAIKSANELEPYADQSKTPVPHGSPFKRSELEFLLSPIGKYRFQKLYYDLPFGTLDSTGNDFNQAFDFEERGVLDKWPSKISGSYSGTEGNLINARIYVLYDVPLVTTRPDGGIGMASLELAADERIIEFEVGQNGCGAIAGARVRTNKGQTFATTCSGKQTETISFAVVTRKFTVPSGYTGLKGFYGTSETLYQPNGRGLDRIGVIWGRE